MLFRSLYPWFVRHGFILQGVLVGGYLLVSLAVAFLFDGTYDSGDSIQHYLFAHYAPHHPELLLDLCGKPFFTGFVKDFLEQKNQEINRITNKLEKIYDKAILQIETLDKIDNALGNNASPPTQYEIAKSIETFQKSKQGLQNANAEFDEAVKSFFDDNSKSKPSPTLPIWILSKLREDWRRDIVEKRRSDINSGCKGIVLQLKTIKYLMEMYWASFIIKIQDYIDRW